MAEAQTLTYNANEQVEGELSAEEQEALEVGEKLAEQQDQLLAGKFKDAEELEKGYIELQKKLGSSEKETKEEVTDTKEEEVEETDVDFLDTLWNEAKDNAYTDATLEQLSKMDTKEVAQMYLDKRAQLEASSTSNDLTEGDVVELKKVAGGEGEYDNMMQWAVDNLSENEVGMYDKVMEQGNPLAAFFAVQALKYRYDDAKGVDGQLLTGKAASNRGDQFRSQAEVVRAMSDPKYDTDPAYRQDVYDKLERSNIQF